MKAALINEFKEPLSIEDVPVPEAATESEVLVKVAACGLCYSDVKIWNGRSSQRPNLPHILGHEIAGTIAWKGRSVSHLEEGDRVVVYLYDTCDKCEACMMGLDNYCTNTGPLLGFSRPGGFAEYVRIPSKNAIKIPPELEFIHAALLPDAVLTPYHAIVDKARVRFNETVMLLGMGGLALCALQILKLLGARVIAVSRTEGKLEFARKMGADSVVNASEVELVKEVKRLTQGFGVDYVFDFVGNEQTVEQDLNIVRKGGRVILLGYEVEPFKVNVYSLMSGLSSLEASRSGTRKNLRDIIKLASEGKVKPVVTAIYPLNEANLALQKLSRGEVMGRIVLTI